MNKNRKKQKRQKKQTKKIITIAPSQERSYHRILMDTKEN